MIQERFKTQFAETIFRTKYAQGPNDSWDALADRLVDDVCGTRGGTAVALMSPDDRKDLAEHIKQMRFLPGGRYLYYAGRPYKAYNDCFSGSTRVLTEEGWKTLADNEGKTLKVLSPASGEWLDAEFKSYGVQHLNTITFAPVRGNSKITWSVQATRQHHWPLVGGKDTYDLRVGDVVPANTYGASFEPLAFAHGFMFGDGNANGQLTLMLVMSNGAGKLKSCSLRAFTWGLQFFAVRKLGISSCCQLRLA